MATEHNGRTFAAEFEALKAKYGEGFSDLRPVRFSESKAPQDWRDYTPYWCRMDDEGNISCEEERPI